MSSGASEPRWSSFAVGLALGAAASTAVAFVVLKLSHASALVPASPPRRKSRPPSPSGVKRGRLRSSAASEDAGNSSPGYASRRESHAPPEPYYERPHPPRSLPPLRQPAASSWSRGNSTPGGRWGAREPGSESTEAQLAAEGRHCEGTAAVAVARGGSYSPPGLAAINGSLPALASEPSYPPGESSWPSKASLALEQSASEYDVPGPGVGVGGVRGASGLASRPVAVSTVPSVGSGSRGTAPVPSSPPLPPSSPPGPSASGASGGNVLMQTYHTPSQSHMVGGQPVVHSTTAASVMASEARAIEDAALHEQYFRVVTPLPSGNEETEEVCGLLSQALDLRRKWLFRPRLGPEELRHLPEAKETSDVAPNPHLWVEPQRRLPWEARMLDGVVLVWDRGAAVQHAAALPQDGILVACGADGGENGYDASPGPATRRPLHGKLIASPPGTATDFFSDLHLLLRIASLGHVRSFAHHRLLLLEQKFNLHVMLNADKEFVAQKAAPHRDFYNVRKVDTHVHHSACMHQKHLLRFMKSKLRKEPEEVVIFRDGKYLTLREVFESLSLTPYDLNVDSLDVHADKNIFHRFDRFNLKYNPFGQSRLREIFIKQDNLLRGRYLAELTKEVLADLEASKYQHTEYRISVYGRKAVEWDTLAAWVVQNELTSDNNRWMIQVPRLYSVYKESGIIENFEQLLHNIFAPLFEVTVDPNSHPQLHLFLQTVSGFDMVDDESKPERRPRKHMPTPAEWNTPFNPSFAYYCYYMLANLYSLNAAREARGLNTFSFRPHSGEAGDVDHLAATFMGCENIAHGINLRKSPPLQYLYYLAQVGLCMSPLSNNSLFLDYHRNPFPTFFARGLSVSLSTDDPLQIHLTKEPLVEEYSLAAQVWKLSATDLCEIARNSVLHSGYPHQVKMHWVHTEYWKMGPEGNNIQKTNVPSLRMRFRKDCHAEEMALVYGRAGKI